MWQKVRLRMVKIFVNKILAGLKYSQNIRNGAMIISKWLIVVQMENVEVSVEFSLMTSSVISMEPVILIMKRVSCIKFLVHHQFAIHIFQLLKEDWILFLLMPKKNGNKSEGEDMLNLI